MFTNKPTGLSESKYFRTLVKKEITPANFKSFYLIAIEFIWIAWKSREIFASAPGSKTPVLSVINDLGVQGGRA